MIQATVWAGIYKSFGFELEEGMKINVIGRIQLYEPSGSYSIVIEKAEPDGVGALAIQFEQLKRNSRKKAFSREVQTGYPQFSKKIGVITSQSGAVIRDIITTVSRRFPGVEILLSNQGTRERELPKKLSPISKRPMIGRTSMLIIGQWWWLPSKTCGPLMKSQL